MADESSASIRPYAKGSDEDNRLARFYIGMANTEGLAVANRKAYYHPIFLAVWVALSCTLIQYLNWWPRPEIGWWTYLKPLPAFAAFSVPLMFAIDWFNRPSFEERTQDVLRRPDMADIPGYYFERSPSSGFWLLQYKDKFVGLIAVDASLDSTSDETVLTGIKSNQDLRNLKKKGTSKVATIRHFYVHEAYRSTGVQDDLIQFAVDRAFGGDKTVETVRAVDCAIDSWVSKCLRDNGFVIDAVLGKAGVLGWPLRSRTLSRARWAELKKERKDE